MAKHQNRNKENFATEEPVVKENSTINTAEAPADQTDTTVSENDTDETQQAVNEDEQATSMVNNDNSEDTQQASSENDQAPVANSDTEEDKNQVNEDEQPTGKQVEVTCDQLYLRPEPNKVGAPLGILTKGSKLLVIESDAKLPIAWIEVETVPGGTHGYVVKEFVTEV